MRVSSNLRWVVAGGLIVVVMGALGFWSSSPYSTPRGLLSAGTTAVLVLAAWWAWSRQKAPIRVPAAEYLAAVWMVSYLALAALAAAGRTINLADWLFIMPPVSLIPLLARLLSRDDGDPAGTARRRARRLHRLNGWLLTGVAGLFALTGFYLFAAPFPLIPGLLHLRAAHQYRAALGGRETLDPRLGFMER